MRTCTIKCKSSEQFLKAYAISKYMQAIEITEEEWDKAITVAPSENKELNETQIDSIKKVIEDIMLNFGIFNPLKYGKIMVEPKALFIYNKMIRNYIDSNDWDVEVKCTHDAVLLKWKTNP